jgi:hypothetical protein
MLLSISFTDWPRRFQLMSRNSSRFLRKERHHRLHCSQDESLPLGGRRGELVALKESNSRLCITSGARGQYYQQIKHLVSLACPKGGRLRTARFRGNNSVSRRSEAPPFLPHSPQERFPGNRLRQ